MYEKIDLFPSVIGNESLKALISQQIQANAVSHAYCIVGDHGSGKTLIAGRICMALACREKIKPCGQCEACRKIAGGLSPDIISVTPPADNKSISVDQIRKIREEAYLSATEFPIKAFLIEHAEAMTQQAQNALLKILETPPPDVYFFLMTERSNALLPTVLSRTQLLKTCRIPDDVLSDWLKNYSVEAKDISLRNPEEYDRIIRRSDGCIGIAKEQLLNRRTSFDPEALSEQYIDLLAGNSHSAFLLFAGSLCKDRVQLREVLEHMLMAVRDLTVRKKVYSAPCMFYREEEKADTLGAQLTFSALMALHSLFSDCLTQLESNANVATVQLLLSEHAWMIKYR